MRKSWHVAMLLAAIVSLMPGASSPALSLDASALGQIAPLIEGRSFRLKVTLHEPETAGESMQAPTLEKKGWHHHNPAGPVALKAGDEVEVTAVFNYSERGLFLELAKAQPGPEREPITARPRIRVRIMVETMPSDPPGQVREATDLIGKVLDLPPDLTAIPPDDPGNPGKP